jgi:hypothetical protein
MKTQRLLTHCDRIKLWYNRYQEFRIKANDLYDTAFLTDIDIYREIQMIDANKAAALSKFCFERMNIAKQLLKSEL